MDQYNSEKMKLPSNWVHRRSKTYPDRMFYFNVMTGDSCWEINDLMAIESKSSDYSPHSSKRKSCESSRSLNSNIDYEKYRNIKSPPGSNSELAMNTPSANHFKSDMSFFSKAPSDSKKRKRDSIEKIEENISIWIKKKPKPESREKIQLSAVTDKLSADSEMDWQEDIDGDVVMMEIDELRQELKDVKPEMKSSTLQAFTEIKQNVNEPDKLQTIYVIVDTNIFISDLKLLEKIPKLNEGDETCKILLVVPWMVLQELDIIKDGQCKYMKEGIRRHAQTAVKFLNSHLATKKPFIIGQTIKEASEIASKMLTKCIDDHILQCSLQFNRKENSIAALLTDDKNLMNKAIINNLYVYSRTNIVQGLQWLRMKTFKQESNGDTVVTYKEEPKVKSDLRIQKKSMPVVKSIIKRTIIKPEKIVCKDVKFSNEMCDILKNILHNALSRCLQTEMEREYEKLWLKVVLIKPPWTLIDILKCVEKHWFAVFGFLWKRDCLNSIEILKHFFERDRGKTQNVDKIKKMVEVSLRLFINIQHHDTYEGIIPTAIDSLGQLSVKIEQPNNSETQSEATEAPSSPCILDAQQSQNILDVFSSIWRIADYTCYVLELLYGVRLDEDPRRLFGNKSFPSKEESVQKRKQLFSALDELCSALRQVLSKMPSLKEDDVVPLYNSLTNFFFRVEGNSDLDSKTSPNSLFLFCLGNRERLEDGLNSFISMADRLIAASLNE